MQNASRHTVRWGATCVLVAAFSTSAAAFEWPDSPWLQIGQEGWIPSLAMSSGAVIQNQEGSANSNCEMGGAAKPPVAGQLFSFASCLFLTPPPEDAPLEPAALRPAVYADQTVVSPFIDIDLQLLTPTLPHIPGNPRLFFRGEVEFIFSATETVANEGNPTGARTPDLIPTLDLIPTEGLAGVGTRVRSEYEKLSFGAGLGIAFPFQFLGRALWIKPGVAWTRYTLDVLGSLEAGLKNDPATVPGTEPRWGSELRSISLRDEESPTFNGVGPSLELELDVGQFGPVGASIFMGGAMYRVLGNRDVDVSLSESFPDGPVGEQPTNPQRFLPGDTYNFNWHFEVDPWLYRARMGIRLHWYGFAPSRS